VGCRALHEDCVARCERYFSQTAPPARPASGIAPAALRKTMAELRRAWREAFGASPFIRFSGDRELSGAACGEAADLFAAGSLTPDHIVYTGAHAVVAESLDELPAKLKPALAEKSFPRVALVRNVGAFVLAADPAKLDAAEDLAVAGARIIRLAAGRGGAHNLSAGFANFIVNWEAEHYRARLTGSAQAPLAGHVALVA